MIMTTSPYKQASPEASKYVYSTINCRRLIECLKVYIGGDH